jgi:hypothetical protein
MHLHLEFLLNVPGFRWLGPKQILTDQVGLAVSGNST